MTMGQGASPAATFGESELGVKRGTSPAVWTSWVNGTWFVVLSRYWATKAFSFWLATVQPVKPYWAGEIGVVMVVQGPGSLASGRWPATPRVEAQT